MGYIFSKIKFKWKFGLINLIQLKPHGLCKELSSLSYECLCFPGYTGRYCDKEVNYCLSQPCLNNATCINSPETNSFKCDCKRDYKGNYCQTKIDACDRNPCFNNGTCLIYNPKRSDIFTCRCLGWLKKLLNKILVFFNRFLHWNLSFKPVLVEPDVKLQ